jgi:hypothetical protein
VNEYFVPEAPGKAQFLLAQNVPKHQFFKKLFQGLFTAADTESPSVSHSENQGLRFYQDGIWVADFMKLCGNRA